MAQQYKSATASSGATDTMPVQELARTLVPVVAFEAAGALLIGAATFVLRLLDVRVPGWSFGEQHELVAHFVGVPGFAAAGLAALALRFDRKERWLLGSALAGVFASVNTLLTVIITVAGIHPEVAWMLGAVEALVLSLWLADLFGHLREPRILTALAVNAFVVLGTLLFLNEQLPAVFPVMVPLVLTVPLIVGAIYESRPVERGPQGAAALVGACLVAMAVLAGVLWLVMLLLP